MHRTIFSPCRQYRYTLWRVWDNLFCHGYVMFICLNPSTADEKKDDPTVRRCVTYVKNWGYSSFCMTNLFAYRTSKPVEMLSFTGDPIGPENNKHLINIAKYAKIIIAAWGINGSYMDRDVEVVKLIRKIKPIHILRLTANGHPNHPLYLKKGLNPVLWRTEKL